MKTVEQDVAELLEAVEKLRTTLLANEIGLISWHTCVRKQILAIADFAGVQG